MFEPFASSRLLLQRAREHVAQFSHRERTWIARKPYSTRTETDPLTGEHIFKVKVSSPDTYLSVIAFDIINCIRSSLDHVFYDSARFLGGTPKPHSTKFPFGKTPDDVENDINRLKGADIPVCLRRSLLDFEPYKGGKHKLWELNELRNRKIHRILQGFAIASSGVGFGNGFFGSVNLSTCNEWDDEQSELTYMKFAAGAVYDIEMQVSVHVALGDTSILGSDPAAKIFAKFIDVAADVGQKIEQETVRLKHS